jgi:class 3 adenylate cyclase
MEVKIGLNAGEPISEGEDLYGSAVNLAARICEQAEENQILATFVIAELSKGRQYSFTDRGEITLKGFQNKVRYYQLNWQ